MYMYMLGLLCAHLFSYEVARASLVVSLPITVGFELDRVYM